MHGGRGLDASSKITTMETVSENQELTEKKSSSSETSPTPESTVTLRGAAGTMAAPVSTGPETSSNQPATTSQTTPCNAEAAPKLINTTPAVTGAKPSGPSERGQPLQVRPSMARVATVAQTPGKALIIAVPRAAAPQTAAAPRPPLNLMTTSVQLPANFQIPPGMVLVRSDSGQLMLVSQQALAQAQQNRASSSPAGRPPAPQVSVTATARKAECVSVIRAPPTPSSTHVISAGKKAPVITVTGVAPSPSVVQTSQPVVRTVSQACPVTTSTTKTNDPKATPPNITRATLENVKKCKNFLVTLIKLTSSGTHSPDMAKNVRELVRSLLDGSVEPEEFTNRLYRELKSSPQPYLVPFLKKSLPAVRQLTPNPQLFIQQVDLPKPHALLGKAPIPTPTARAPTPLSVNIQPSTLRASSGGHPIKPTQLMIQHPRGVAIKQALTSSPTSQTFLSVQSRTVPKPTVIQAEQRHAGAFVRPAPPQAPPSQIHSGGYYREDDDINDVASMAGVNLSEENARILATNSAMVGSVVRSCRDDPFLPPAPLLTRILHTGSALGVSSVGPDVVSLVSHATQERLRDMLEKVTAVARHRKIALKDDVSHAPANDVRSQLRFLEQLERLEKQRRDDEERETLLRIAKSRSHTEDPDQQLLKQRAKELQQMEQAQQQHREANLTALAAIGPRRKTLLVSTGSQAGGAGSCVSALPRAGLPKVTRVTLRDLQFCMEQDPALRHSLTLYKALLR